MPIDLSAPLVGVDELAAAMRDDAVRIVDTRWKLGSPEAGREAFEAGHIPGAIHLDVDRDLAAAPGPAGRHPLPSTTDFAEKMTAAGIDAHTTVVAYDDGDATGAARLWWLLRHFGHDSVVVLDGGLRAWKAAGKPTEAGAAQAPSRLGFVARPRSDDYLDLEGLQSALRAAEVHLLDARTPERWRGDVEPVDRIPGRIPGAINAPAAENLGESGFHSAGQLRSYYAALRLLDGKLIVAACGSGITACVDLLGLEVAGVHGARLYPGSYSEWIARGLPVETGS
jgi:thiosulfate/3-mercaptopyruvate sulfurtransferase